MDARRQADTTETTTTETPAPATPKRERGTTTDGVKAGQLFEKLTQLDADEQAELAASPADIRAKFEDRRAKAQAKYPESVRLLAGKMRAKT